MSWDTKVVAFVDPLGYLHCADHEPLKAIQAVHGDAYFGPVDVCDFPGCGKRILRNTEKFNVRS